MVHRTLVQGAEDPRGAPAALARLLAQLDLTSAAGVITTSWEVVPAHPGGEQARRTGRTGADDDLIAGSGGVRFRFVPFTSPAPGRHTGAEYL